MFMCMFTSAHKSLESVHRSSLLSSFHFTLLPAVPISLLLLDAMQVRYERRHFSLFVIFVHSELSYISCFAV